MWIQDPNDFEWHAVKAPMPGPIPGARGVTCCNRMITGIVAAEAGKGVQCVPCLKNFTETLDPPPYV